MRNTKITIPKPCNQGWDNMTPNNNGRHCLTCNKTVVDFTSMTPDEIKEYFYKRQSQKICGHFKATQVAAKRPRLHTQLINLHQYIEQKVSLHFLKVAALAIVTLCMTLTGCNPFIEGKKTIDKNETEQHITGDVIAVPPKDTTLTVDGMIMPPPPADSAKTKK